MSLTQKSLILSCVTACQWFAVTLSTAGALSSLPTEGTGFGRGQAKIGFGAIGSEIEAIALPQSAEAPAVAVPQSAEAPAVAASTAESVQHALPSIDTGAAPMGEVHPPAWLGVEIAPVAGSSAAPSLSDPAAVDGPAIELFDAASAVGGAVPPTSATETPAPDLAGELARANEAVRVLGESLAIANGEAELFRRKYTELKLRMEALGLESANPDRAALEQRVLHAVNDLRLERERSERLRDQLMLLAEAMLPYLAASEVSNAELRSAVEAEMRDAARLAFPETETTVGTAGDHLTNARVLSVKQEWALVVGSLGNSQGVRIGMPFRVVREGREVAQVRVVDVRDRVFGAVLEPLKDGTAAQEVRVGDALQVAVQ